MKYFYLAVALGVAALSVPAQVTLTYAADLAVGGDCCADLEDRVAELETTAARKGNKKVTLKVYGQVSKALFSISGDTSVDNVDVIENSAAETFAGFAGEAKFADGWAAGYVLEIGLGGTDSGPADANDIYLRRSFAYVASKQLGQLSVGHLSQATDEIAEITVANTKHVARLLSLRPINGPQLGEVLDLFDGTRTDAVRYDTPSIFGATVSASWANGDPGFGSDADVWDVALRWGKDFEGFRVAAGVGYRKGIVVPTIGNFAGDMVTVISGSGSIKHIDTGLFLSAAAGQLKIDGGSDVVAYHAQAGIERKWNSLGLTTLYGEYADSSDLDINIVGVGVNQQIEGAGIDFFLTGRSIDFAGQDANTVMLGARVQF